MRGIVDPSPEKRTYRSKSVYKSKRSDRRPATINRKLAAEVEQPY